MGVQYWSTPFSYQGSKPAVQGASIRLVILGFLIATSSTLIYLLQVRLIHTPFWCIVCLSVLWGCFVLHFHPVSWHDEACAFEEMQGDSVARGPKLLSVYTVELCRFLVHKYWQRGSFKACQMAFRMEFDARCAPSKCCIQKLVKKLETRGSRSDACRLLSLGPIEGQSVQKYTPHNQTTQRRYTPRD